MEDLVDLSVMEDLAAGEIKHSAQPPPVTIITEEMRVRHAEHVQKGLKRAAAAAERKAAALRQKQERTRRLSKFMAKKYEFEELVTELASSKAKKQNSVSAAVTKLMTYNKTVYREASSSRIMPTRKLRSIKSPESRQQHWEERAITTGSLKTPPWAVMKPDLDHFVRPTTSHANFIAHNLRRRTESVARLIVQTPNLPTSNDIRRSALSRDLTDLCQSIVKVDNEVLHGENNVEAVSSSPLFQSQVSQAINMPYEIICHHPSAIAKIYQKAAQEAIIQREFSNRRFGSRIKTIKTTCDDDMNDAIAQGYIRPASISASLKRRRKAISASPVSTKGPPGRNLAKSSNIEERPQLHPDKDDRKILLGRQSGEAVRNRHHEKHKVPTKIFLAQTQPQSSLSMSLINMTTVSQESMSLMANSKSSGEDSQVQPAAAAAIVPLTHSFGRSIPGMTKEKLKLAQDRTIENAHEKEKRAQSRSKKLLKGAASDALILTRVHVKHLKEKQANQAKGRRIRGLFPVASEVS